MGKRFEFDEGDGSLGEFSSNGNKMFPNTPSYSLNNEKKNVPSSATTSTSHGPSGDDTPWKNTPGSQYRIPGKKQE